MREKGVYLTHDVYLYHKDLSVAFGAHVSGKTLIKLHRLTRYNFMREATLLAILVLLRCFHLDEYVCKGGKQVVNSS